jgi:hypothetical protein
MVSTALLSSSSSSTTTAASNSESRELLLLQKEIFTIYLEPLLKIHNNGASARGPNNNVLTYEDLTSSFQAAVASLGKTTNVDSNCKSIVVSVTVYNKQIHSFGQDTFVWFNIVELLLPI